jgi:hypothetical protein
MGWLTRSWQSDEALVDNAHELMQGVSDADAVAALLASILAEPAGGDDR